SNFGALAQTDLKPPTVFYLSLEVPADLRGVGTTLPWHILVHDMAATDYHTVQELPQFTPIAGLHRMSTGDWLISVEFPTTLGGRTWLPQDVFRYSPLAGTFSCFLTGSAVG